MKLFRTVSAISLLLVTSSFAAEKPPQLEFTRIIAHWANYGGDDYLQFVKEAQPDLAQIGFYGGHFWSLAHTPQYKGYPAHLPVRGIDECGKWFATRNAAIHKLGTKVIGHFNVEFLVGDPSGPKGPRGFFKFYRQLWDEKQLGPKPVADPIDLLEKDDRGKPITQKGYQIGGMREYWACLRNPHWQVVLKAWTKMAIRRGVDGLIVNYFYRHNCRCQHCERGFRGYLTKRFTNSQLKTSFKIADLKTHKFTELVSWHDPAKSTPLRREMLRWSQISNKRVFDDVFVKYGRSLKPDFIVAQWNHLGNFGQINGDERCMMPSQLWGKDESYLWYSLGGSAFFTDLKKKFLGDATLQARYIRTAFHDKPFTIGKYESTRIRSAISELAANGGAPMGFYTRFTDPLARREITRYYQFLKRHDALYRANRSHAELALIFPRSHIHAGRLGPLNKFREMGKKLLESHLLFDVIPDDMASKERLAQYKFVAKPTQALPDFASTTSRFQAPFTVRVSASRPAKGNDLVIHYVNYNRSEPKRAANGRPSAGGGIKDEKPIAVSGIQSDIVLPAGLKVIDIQFLNPEQATKKLTYTLSNGRIKFQLPKFLVYGVAHIRLK